MARSQTNPVILGIETDTISNYQRKLNKREAKLAEAILYSENIDDDFSSALVVSNYDNVDGTIYTGAAGEELGFHSGRAAYEMHVAVTAGAALVVPFQSTDGLEVQPQAAAADLEITNGTTALARTAHVVGSLLATDAKEVFLKATIKIDDISDVTLLRVGMRKAEAYQADTEDYDEMAAWDIGSGANARINIATILNDGTTAVTDTTEADWVDDVAGTGTHTLEITVNYAGVCKFKIDGAEPTVTTAFTFDAGEVIIPFLMLNTVTGDPGVSVSAWKTGYR